MRRLLIVVTLLLLVTPVGRGVAAFGYGDFARPSHSTKGDAAASAELDVHPAGAAVYAYDGGADQARAAPGGVAEGTVDQVVRFIATTRSDAHSGYDDLSNVARADSRPGRQGLAPNTARLASRADELHGALDPIAQTRRTTAVMGTRQGTDVLAGGVRDLSPAQRALARPGDVLGRLPGEHAEITALKAAGEAGLTPQGIATTTNICPACRVALEEAGVTITGPRSAWWSW